MKVDHRMLSLLIGDRFFLYLIITAGVLITFAVVSQAYILSYVVNLLFTHKTSYSYLLFPLSLFLLFAVLRSLFTWVFEYYSGILGINIVHKVRLLVSKHIANLGSEYLKRERSGEIVNTVIKGTDALEPYFGQYLPSLFLALLSPLIIVCFAFYIDLISGCILIVTAPLVPVFMYLIGGKAKIMTEKQWKMLSFLSAHFLDVIQGLTTYKVFGQSKVQIDKISTISEKFRHSTMKTLKVAFISSLALELIATLSTAILAVSVGLRLLYGYLGYQEALFVLIIAPEFYAPLRNLGARFHAGMEGLSSGKRIFNILETKTNTDINISTMSKPENIENLTINFENVTFRYKGQHSFALNQLSFTVSPREKVAIIGPTGAGKSTIINSLLSFITPSSGDILIGNFNLKHINADYWRSVVSWIPQKPYLFNCSIRENLCLGSHHNIYDDTIIKKAASIANLDDFIQSLENGYDTIIGERGLRLSGGQAQRLAIARAVIKNAPIVIMDEPTSNIDSLYENSIITKLGEWSRDKTVITIAHRLNTIEKSDKIFTIANGQIQKIKFNR